MIKTTPPKKIKGVVKSTLAAKGEDFISKPVDSLALNYEGIEGDFHAGITRLSGGREPWYDRGTQMRNERQISILSVEELNEIQNDMGLEKFDAGWIGANLILEGIPNLSYLPPRTLLFFEGGVTLRIDGYNAPCRLAGGAIAEHSGVEAIDGAYDRTDMALSFKNAAHMKRGLVAWVEIGGTIKPNEQVTARIWEQWVY
ncbi:MAG: molybdenum cofactor sulfurase [Nitratireductor sp.]